MWAHDLRRVGRIDEAIVQFQKADTLERTYYKEEKIDPQLDWHHGHNLDLLATSYQHKGQMKLAEKTMREAAALKPIDATRAFSMRELPNFLLHRGRYSEALQAARDLTRTEFAQSRSVGYALAGHALIGLGKIGEADEELESAKRELESIPRITPGIVPNRQMVEPWVDALRGELLLRTGQTDEGRTILQNVQRALRATPGPDAWTQALFRLESMARAARETGNWDLAEFSAQQMLDHDAAYGGSHLAMALVSRQKGDSAAMSQSFKVAMQYWRDADSDLPELKLIRQQTVAADVSSHKK
jgi:Tfp pilus assembly protein PilF